MISNSREVRSVDAALAAEFLRNMANDIEASVAAVKRHLLPFQQMTILCEEKTDHADELITLNSGSIYDLLPQQEVARSRTWSIEIRTGRPW